MLNVKSFLVVKASELSMTPTNTPQTTLHSSTQLFTFISVPHTQVTLTSQRERESRLQDYQGEAVLLSKQSTPINRRHVCPLPLRLSARLSHSSTLDLLSFPSDLCLFCHHPSLLIHTIYSNWCSYLTTSPKVRQVSVFNYILISYITKHTFQCFHYHITSTIMEHKDMGPRVPNLNDKIIIM